MPNRELCSLSPQKNVSMNGLDANEEAKRSHCCGKEIRDFLSTANPLWHETGDSHEVNSGESGVFLALLVRLLRGGLKIQ